jgi:hypothetical protein
MRSAVSENAGLIWPPVGANPLKKGRIRSAFSPCRLHCLVGTD